MGKRGRFIVGALVVALLAVLAWTLLRAPAPAPEPVYNGKPLSYWLQGFGPYPNTTRPTETEALVAIQQIGTNAIPTLLQMLRAHDSPLKYKLRIWAIRRGLIRIIYKIPWDYNNSLPFAFNFRAMRGFQQLGPLATNAVPDLIRVLDHPVSPESESLTAGALGAIGPGAKAAVPALLRAAASTDLSVRNAALLALGQIHADPDAVVPVLIKGLQNPSNVMRWTAAGALGNFQSEAKSAVPALVALLNDPNLNLPPVGTAFPGRNDLRTQVEHALKQIDPETYARVVTNAAPDSTR